MAVNNAKPYELQQIAGYAFAVPETLVTTSPEAVRTFHERHGRVIYKSVSGVRSIVSILREDAQERLENVANGPTQFLEYVPGCDVRVPWSAMKSSRPKYGAARPTTGTHPYPATHWL